MTTEMERLREAVAFWSDPLDTALPLPIWALDDVCDCDPAAHHSLRCPATPIYTAFVYDMARGLGRERPPSFFDGDPWPEGWRIRYCCVGTISGLGHHHLLGEINGPTHWCEGLRRVVEAGE